MHCGSNQNDWDQFLPQVMMAYRSSVHSSTGQTPNKMVFGREIVLPLQAYTGLPPQSNFSCEGLQDTQTYVSKLKSQLENTHSLARKHLKKKTDYQKRHYDLQAKRRSFNVGDAVWMHDSTRKRGVCSKLSPHWKGPFVITRRIDDLVYLVKNSAKSPAKAIHIDRLTPYNCPSLPSWILRYKKDHDLATN
jgi:hypothetical protein